MSTYLENLEKILGADGTIGMFQLVVITDEEMLSLAVAAFTGDQQAERYAHVIDKVADSVLSGEAQCLCCHAAFSDITKFKAVGILINDNGVGAVGNSLCQPCYEKPNLMINVLEAYKEIGLENYKILPAPGRA
jgi:hypothetical protein